MLEFEGSSRGISLASTSTCIVITDDTRAPAAELGRPHCKLLNGKQDETSGADTPTLEKSRCSYKYPSGMNGHLWIRVCQY